MTKNILLAVFALSTLLAGSPAQAATKIQESNSWSFIIPKDRDGNKDFEAKFSPPSVQSLTGTLTCYLAHTGKGTVGAISFSGVVSDQQVSVASVAIYDSSIVTHHSAASIDTARLLFAGKLDTYRQSFALNFSPPLPYDDGLVLCGGATTVVQTVRFNKHQS